MANTSIFAAFEEMWQRVIFALNGKSDVSHKHDDTYETKTDASNKLGEAKEYTDTHNVATDAHNDIRLLISELVTKLNNFLDVDDTTTDQLSEVITLINNNKGTLESLTTSKVNVADIIDNLTTNVSNKPLSAAQAVVLKGLIDDLETELSNHTHDTYETKTDASTKLDEAKSYTDTKIAAIPRPDVSGQINEHNTSETAHDDIRDSITDLEEVVVYIDKEDNEDVPDEIITASGVVVDNSFSNGAVTSTTVQGVLEEYGNHLNNMGNYLENLSASNVAYDNSASQGAMTSTNVQDAFDELGTVVVSIYQNVEDLISEHNFNYQTPTFQLCRCTGTINASQVQIGYANSGRTIQICGRIIITNFVRTEQNPGVYVELPFSANSSADFCVGHRTGTDKEVVIVNVTKDSNKLSIVTSETYVNAANGTFTLIVPLVTIHVP